jgi:hypothetical protein
VSQQKDFLNHTFYIEYVTEGEDGDVKPTKMLHDTPNKGQVKNGKYVYYKFTFDDLNEKHIMLYLTPISGECDMVVSLGAKIQYPAKDNYDISTRKQGS